MEKVASLTYSDVDSVGGINELQDEILVLILSKLSMKEAARTSVLSHRWEKLWIYYTGSLKFDYMDALVNILLKNSPEGFERLRFISWVNQILNLHRGQTVDEFRILFDLDECVAEDIERWIKFAVEKRVRRFELDFSSVDGTKTQLNCYPFPSELLYLPSGSTSFGSLVTLRLNSVDLSDEVLTSFILNCQSLEQLSIKGAISLTCLKATTALKLKHLEIEYCLGLRIVEVAYTNIQSLRFVGNMHTRINYCKELPLLNAVSLGGTYSSFVLMSEFIQFPISQLQTLQLHLDHVVNFGWEVFPERFPTLLNLKYLEVRLAPGHDQSIFCLTSLIYASPVLSRFTLKVRYQKPRERKHELPNCHWRKAEKHAHQCLKVVEFIGWYGVETDVELVSYLIENGPLLEKVIIDPQIPPLGKEKIVFRGREKEREEASRICAKQLEEKMRPGTKLVIL